MTLYLLIIVIRTRFKPTINRSVSECCTKWATIPPVDILWEPLLSGLLCNTSFQIFCKNDIWIYIYLWFYSFLTKLISFFLSCAFKQQLYPSDWRLATNNQRLAIVIVCRSVVAWPMPCHRSHLLLKFINIVIIFGLIVLIGMGLLFFQLGLSNKFLI